MAFNDIVGFDSLKGVVQIKINYFISWSSISFMIRISRSR